MQKIEKLINLAANIHRFRVRDDGTFPNSSFPAMIYEKAVRFDSLTDAAEAFETVFAANRWGNGWRDGIYDYHHYHSTSHEVLGVYRGWALVELGGPKVGVQHRVREGDVIVIPAGVAHKNLGCSDDFATVGVYPDGKEADMCYGRDGERPRSDESIAALPLPSHDPVFGLHGPIQDHWRK
jgi:uncharacterized protein YjlB